MNGNTDNFDTHLRARHAAALAQLSPQVQAQLAQRRNAALRGNGIAKSGHRLRLAAAAFASVCALTVGVQFFPQSQPTLSPATTAAVAITKQATTASATARGNAALEEDPDFYAWLGASETRQLAME
ncbi:MAG TPA: hypothetical protein PL007_00520 [Thermomonas sp.]|jgi:hypothetical protein|nr:hypothetical protein [Thermomonas sp.]HQY48831.1 hypothetical protein [Thermomonas sp.]HRA57358.1 hypothetical protein [Thermomonas sp.]